MKKIFFLFIGIILLSSLSSLDLEVNKKSSDEVMIKELQNPIVFDLEIRNLGERDTLRFYNLVGFQMDPSRNINIGKNETKYIQLEVTPLRRIDSEGYYTFNYFIRGEDKIDIKKRLTFKIVLLEDVFELSSEKIHPEDNFARIFIENKINHNFEEIQGKFKSSFFSFDKTFSLDAYEKKSFTIDLNHEEIKNIVAGFYSIKGNLSIEEKETELEGVIEFSEKDSLRTEESQNGFFIREKIIKKINEGNILIDSRVSIEKNILSRLFTSFNLEPDFVERKGSEINYVWRQQLAPGEEMEVRVKTNWIIPLIFVIGLILLIVLLKKYSKKDVEIRKRLSFVKTKGGEFALKVKLIIVANEYVEKVNIIDKLPPLVKLYHKFLSEEPTKVNEKGRKLEWDFSRLEKGEKRIIDYVIYSKIGVLGKFALPPAIAIFEKDGRIKESSSNRAFFVSEQKGKQEETY